MRCPGLSVSSCSQRNFHTGFRFSFTNGLWPMWVSVVERNSTGAFVSPLQQLDDLTSSDSHQRSAAFGACSGPTPVEGASPVAAATLVECRAAGPRMLSMF